MNSLDLDPFLRNQTNSDLYAEEMCKVKIYTVKF